MTNVCFVSGNFYSKFYLNIMKGFWVMVQCFSFYMTSTTTMSTTASTPTTRLLTIARLFLPKTDELKTTKEIHESNHEDDQLQWSSVNWKPTPAWHYGPTVSDFRCLINKIKLIFYFDSLYSFICCILFTIKLRCMSKTTAHWIYNILIGSITVEKSRLVHQNTNIFL